MEKLGWFKFVISDWMMGKIQKCPEVTQARFLRLCCLYWNKECVLSYDDAQIEIDEDHLNILISKRIIVINDIFIQIKFLDEQNSEVLSLSETRRLAAKERWNKLKQQADAMQMHANASNVNANAMQSDAEKNRVEEIRVDKSREEESVEILKIDFEDFWNFYDKKVGEKEKIKRKWDKLKLEDQDLVFAHIPKYRESQPDKKFRKNPETYLNNKSWLDEIIESKPTIKFDEIKPSKMAQTYNVVQGAIALAQKQKLERDQQNGNPII